MDVISLVSKKVSLADETEKRANVLMEALKDVTEGNIDSLFLLTRRTDGVWTWAFAGDRYTTEMIGWMEIAKQEWIGRFLAATEPA